MSKLKLSRIRTYLIVCLVVSLCLCGLAGIIILIRGSFGIIEQKVLATTLIFAGYSILGLCCSVLAGKQKYLFVAYAGILVCIAGTIYSLFFIWAQLDSANSNFGKVMTILAVAAVLSAHNSLILTVRADKRFIRVGMYATIGAMIAVALMVVYLILFTDVSFEYGLYFRIMGVFGILTALGTVSVPILARVFQTPDSHPAK